MTDDTAEILAGVACAAEEAALSHFLSTTAAYMQEHPTVDDVVAEVFARAFAAGLMMAAVGILRDAGVSLSDAEKTLRSMIGAEVFSCSAGDA
jgi:hypothetical protein